MDKIFQDFINHLTPEHFEGWLLYVIGAGAVTLVHIINARRWKIGLAGENKRWEGPEMVLYLCSWIFPYMILADGCLDRKFSDQAWWTIWALMAYGLTGRFGLEWLLAVKNGQPMPQKEKINIQTNTQSNQEIIKETN